MSMIGYEGIGEVVITQGVHNEVDAGNVVRMQENDCVCACEDGEQFCGVALNCRGGRCSVKMKGFAGVTYTGELELGWNNLVADGKGGVRVGDAGVRALVVHVDTGLNTAVICL